MILAAGMIIRKIEKLYASWKSLNMGRTAMLPIDLVRRKRCDTRVLVFPWRRKASPTVWPTDKVYVNISGLLRETDDGEKRRVCIIYATDTYLPLK